jgi:Putative transposase DNA-binding domain
MTGYAASDEYAPNNNNNNNNKGRFQMTNSIPTTINEETQLITGYKTEVNMHLSMNTTTEPNIDDKQDDNENDNEKGMSSAYQYGLLEPTTNADQVWDQMKRAHNYKKGLTEIECVFRKGIREVESVAGNIPELEKDFTEKEQAFLGFHKEIKTANAKLGHSLVKSGKTPKKVPLSPEQKAEKDALKKAMKEAKQTLQDARRLIRQDSTIKEKRDALYEQLKAQIRDLRKSDGAPWYGTYMLIEDAFKKTRAMPLYDGAKPNDPWCQWHFSGEGRIGIKQFQPHEPIAKVIGTKPTSSMIQIIPAPPPRLGRDGKARRVGNKDLRVLRLRIGTAEGKPIWAEFPMVYHRPIPPNSVIQMVQVSCRKIGTRTKWTVAITVNHQQPTITDPNALAVGIDLGWRKVSEGLRIAMWSGSDGNEGEIICPQSVLDQLTKATEIKSIRDKEFDNIKPHLLAFVKNEFVPDWLKDRVKTLDKWRSQSNMVKLLRHWKTERFAGDEEIWKKLEAWRYHERHLYQWERELDNKGRGHRREIYRVAAAKFAEQYGTVGFENIRLDNMARSGISGGNRFLSSPSEFRNACKNAIRARGREYVEIPAAYTTIDHKCGHKNENIGAKMEYTCGGCGEQLDRDENAARNILDKVLKREQSGDAKSAAPARDDRKKSEVGGLQEGQAVITIQKTRKSKARKEVLANQVATV